MKAVITNLATVLVTSVFMLLVGEFIVRSIFADDTVLFPRYHTDAQYQDFTIRRIRPNSNFWHTSIDGSWQFITNAQGFRNTRDFAYEKPPGTLRVLALGDSHTQGYEVRQESTFAAVIERSLKKAGQTAEVINAGVSGFSTAEELVFLENEGIKYQPDFVVLGFYRNDIEDNLKAGLFDLDESGRLVVARKSHVPGVATQNFIYSVPGMKWLGENSYFYSVLFNLTWDYFKQRLKQSRTSETREFAVPQQEDYSDYETTLAAKLLQRVQDFCTANNIKLVIIDIPVVDADTGINTSFPRPLRQQVRVQTDVYIDSLVLFENYAGVADLHVPHGHRHISEFAHVILGVAVAQAILGLQDDG